MPVQAFVDDSGGKGHGTHFVLAGLIADAENWAQFSDAWHLCLGQDPAIAYFKMREATGLRDCHRTSDSIYRYLRQDLVVPFSMEGIAFNVECGDLFIGDLEAGRVEV